MQPRIAVVASIRMRWLRLIPVLMLIMPAGIFGQPPILTSVLNFGSHEARFSPGVLAEVRYQSAESFNNWTAQVGGRPVTVMDNEDGLSFNILLSKDQPLGPTTVVVTTRAGNSGPYSINVDAYAPGLVGTAPMRTPNAPSPFDCKPGLTATAGETLTLLAVGLGATDGSASHATLAKPSITVGGKSAEVVDSGDGGPLGIYKVRFIVPPGEGWHHVVLTIAGQQSNEINLPVGRAMLNIATPTFRHDAAAPEAIETAYSCSSGGGLANVDRLVSGSPPNLPTNLGGTTIKVKDSNGVERLAQLYGVVPHQVNYLIPPGTAAGLATVTATSSDGVITEGDVHIQSVAPSFFYGGLQVVRLRDGVQTIESTVKDGAAGNIDMGLDSDQVYLVMYGTGLRSRSSLANVNVKIGGIDVPVEYAGAQSQLPGLDQVNLKLPRSLAGRGHITLEFAADGKRANDTYLNFE